MIKSLFRISLLIILMGFYSNAEALTVSPAKLEITGDPGTVVTGEIELFNEQDTPKTFFTSYENFEPQGDTGAPYFVGGEEGLATWINTPVSVELQPGERIAIPYSITIPTDASAGGYFSAIFLSNQPPVSESGGEVTIGGKIGILILLRVSGYVEEKGGLLSFVIKENQRFFTSLPITFEYRFNNQGGDRVSPLGEIKVKNTLRLTSGTLNANKNQGSILPNSERRFEVVWDSETDTAKNLPNLESNQDISFLDAVKQQIKNFHFGLYTADLNITWGETKQTAHDSYVFFIIPWQLLSVIFGILLIIAFILKKVLKKYNEFVINQFKQSK